MNAIARTGGIGKRRHPPVIARTDEARARGVLRRERLGLVNAVGKLTVERNLEQVADRAGNRRPREVAG